MTLCIAMANYEVLSSIFLLNLTWDSFHIMYIVLGFASDEEFLKALAKRTHIIIQDVDVHLRSMFLSDYSFLCSVGATYL